MKGSNMIIKLAAVNKQFSKLLRSNIIDLSDMVSGHSKTYAKIAENQIHELHNADLSRIARKRLASNLKTTIDHAGTNAHGTNWLRDSIKSYARKAKKGY
jgi:hypothetical protein